MVRVEKWLISDAREILNNGSFPPFWRMGKQDGFRIQQGNWVSSCDNIRGFLSPPALPGSFSFCPSLSVWEGLATTPLFHNFTNDPGLFFITGIVQKKAGTHEIITNWSF